jgi:hypothetical protein
VDCTMGGAGSSDQYGPDTTHTGCDRTSVMVDSLAPADCRHRTARTFCTICGKAGAGHTRLVAKKISLQTPRVGLEPTT